MTSVWYGSPNYTMGRPVKIDRIVIHWIVGNLSAADATFQNTLRKTSAHYGIENTTVHQYVRDTDTAWHAGTAAMNARSVGIEHSAAPDRPASATTIDTSARLVADLCRKHGIPCDRSHIIKHSQVVATQCPGTIPIDTIIAKANVYLKGGNMIGNKNHVNILFRQFFGRSATATEQTRFSKQSLEYLLNNGLHKNRTDLPATLATLKKTQDALKQANAALDQAKLQYDVKGDLQKQIEASEAKNDKLIAEIEKLKGEKTTRDEAVNSLWTTIGDLLNKVMGRNQ